MDEDFPNWANLNDLLPDAPVKDERTQSCPSCEGVLPKVPGAKTKCPHCGEFIFVRTDPDSSSRRLVNETEAKRLEKLWSIRRPLIQSLPINESDMQKIHLQHPEVSQVDAVKFALRNLAQVYSERHMWGLFRNTYFELAEVERRAGAYDAALWYYFDVNYLDQNGADNASEFITNGAVQWIPADPEWNINLAFRAPAVIEITLDLLNFLGLEKSSAIRQYEERGNALRVSLGLPLNWSSASPKIFAGNES